MNTFTDEQLSVFMDGGAEPELESAISDALETDTALQARLETMQANDELLRAAFDAELAGSSVQIPDAIPAPSARIISFPRRPVAVQRWQMAAAALLTVSLGWGIAQVTPTGSANPVTLGSNGLVASADLARGLSDAQSGVPEATGAGTIKVALSFRASGGDLCRQFTLQSNAQASSGVACNAGGEWQIKGWMSRGGTDAGSYRTASGPDDAAMNAILDRIGVAATLDQSGERAAIKSGWTAEPK